MSPFTFSVIPTELIWEKKQTADQFLNLTNVIPVEKKNSICWLGMLMTILNQLMTN